jgi:leukotriene-A4 hydrolase
MTEQPSTESASNIPDEEAFAKLDAGPDPHSYARPDQVRVVHVGLNWVVDFDAQSLTGDAILLLDRSDPTAPLILDNRDLDLKAVHAAALTV